MQVSLNSEPHGLTNNYSRRNFRPFGTAESLICWDSGGVAALNHRLLLPLVKADGMLKPSPPISLNGEPNEVDTLWAAETDGWSYAWSYATSRLRVITPDGLPSSEMLDLADISSLVDPSIALGKVHLASLGLWAVQIWQHEASTQPTRNYVFEAPDYVLLCTLFLA